MLPSGNSDVGPCAACLLSTMQREVPYARSKGIDPDVMDMPLDVAEGYLDESARNVLAEYEERVDVDSVEFDFEAGENPWDAPYRVTMVDRDGEEV